MKYTKYNKVKVSEQLEKLSQRMFFNLILWMRRVGVTVADRCFDVLAYAGWSSRFQ